MAATVQLRAVVDAHVPLSPREVAAKERFLAELDRLADPCDEHADPAHVTASASSSAGAARCSICTSVSASGCSPAATSTPARRRPRPPGVRPSRSWAWRSRIPPGGPRLIHLDVHEAALGHTHLDLRYLLFGADDDPHPPPGESPEARWCDWDEAAATSGRGTRTGTGGRPRRVGRWSP